MLAQPSHTLSCQEFWNSRQQYSHCELVDGRVVPMSPTGRKHGRVELRIAVLIDQYLEQRGIGEVVTGEVGYQLKEGLVRAADIAVHLTPPPETDGWETEPPDLIVEVISPSDTWQAIEQKVDEYLAAGVPEVWVADPSRETITIRSANQPPATYQEKNAIHSRVLGPDFSVTPMSIFQVRRK